MNPSRRMCFQPRSHGSGPKDHSHLIKHSLNRVTHSMTHVGIRYKHVTSLGDLEIGGFVGLVADN